MKPSMLAYTQLILEKVSFSKELYEREYRKALNRLSSREAQLLEQWAHRRRRQLVPVSTSH